jgi:hypothetical protein
MHIKNSRTWTPEHQKTLLKMGYIAKQRLLHIFFVLPSVEGHLGCFQWLSTLNRAVVTMVEQVPCGRVDDVPRT